MAPQRLHIRIYGRVQGVGYRFFALQIAEGLGLTGWVRNRPDGSVEVVAEGPEQILRAFRDYLQEGPRMARVDRTDVEWQVATGEFRDFGVG